jgi:hypothetical protein
VYRLVHTPEALDQPEALPPEALAPYAELLAMLELTPWSGEPQNKANPDGAVRRWAFGLGGTGQVVYLVVDHPSEVHVLMIQWIG